MSTRKRPPVSDPRAIPPTSVLDERPTVELTPIEVGALLQGTSSATVEMEPIDDRSATVEMIPIDQLAALDDDADAGAEPVSLLENVKLARGSDAVPAQQPLVRPRGARLSREVLRVADIASKAARRAPDHDD